MADQQIVPSNTSEIDYKEEIEGGKKHRDKLLETWQQDADWRLKMRKFLAPAFLVFLCFQNVFVYSLIAYSFWKHNTQDLQVILSVLIAGTIGQTIMVIKIIVTWIFSDIKYHEHPSMNSK